MTNATLAHAPAPSDEQIDRILDATADSFVRQLRSPILHAPSEQKVAYEEVALIRFRRQVSCVARVDLSYLLRIQCF
jgi:hypothetical protein